MQHTQHVKASEISFEGPMGHGSFKDDLCAQIPRLRAFAVSLCGSVAHADDLVQEALLRAWANSEKFQPGTSLRAWLFTILRNVFYSQRRKRSRERQVSGVYFRTIAVAGNQESHVEPLGLACSAGQAASRAARSLDVGWRRRGVLRRGCSHLRREARHDQEPGQSWSNQAQRTHGTRSPRKPDGPSAFDGVEARCKLASRRAHAAVSFPAACSVLQSTATLARTLSIVPSQPPISSTS